MDIWLSTMCNILLPFGSGSPSRLTLPLVPHFAVGWFWFGYSIYICAFLFGTSRTFDVTDDGIGTFPYFHTRTCVAGVFLTF